MDQSSDYAQSPCQGPLKPGHSISSACSDLQAGWGEGEDMPAWEAQKRKEEEMRGGDLLCPSEAWPGRVGKAEVQRGTQN